MTFYFPSFIQSVDGLFFFLIPLILLQEIKVKIDNVIEFLHQLQRRTMCAQVRIGIHPVRTHIAVPQALDR